VRGFRGGVYGIQTVGEHLPLRRSHELTVEAIDECGHADVRRPRGVGARKDAVGDGAGDRRVGGGQARPLRGWTGRLIDRHQPSGRDDHSGEQGGTANRFAPADERRLFV
jgi:hypothetical protein